MALVEKKSVEELETDFQGWFNAWRGTTYTWRGWRPRWRPRLYYPATLQYRASEEFITVDGMGREELVKNGIQYECTINPVTGKFERLCVQTRDSLCNKGNTTWDRTIVRRATPGILSLCLYPYRHIPRGKRHDLKSWTSKEKAHFVLRWIAASLGITFLIFLPIQDYPRGKNPWSYLPFLYNGYRYPRLARHFWENRDEVRAERAGDPSWVSGDLGIYRAFKPAYLCYLIEVKVENGVRPYFETREVGENEHIEYVFISYTKSQFQSENEEQQEENYHALFNRAIQATKKYFGNEWQNKAFWLDMECLQSNSVQPDMDQKRSVDDDIYRMSDIIRGAKQTIIIARTNQPTPVALRRPSESDETNALREWGQRVWTFPEVLLSKGDTVTFVINLAEPKEISKLSLAQRSWEDANDARQLVEHFSSLHLSRLELLSIAMKCLTSRHLQRQYPGDLSYALMGLLRVRPAIDSSDSSFQAFARLSLPQDNDRLMERLICLLPECPSESWHSMTDKYKSTLWDIYPDTQVCGIGENDTIVVDGFKGALIQWSMFSKVQTLKRASWKRKGIEIATMFAVLFLLIGVSIVALSKAAGAVFLVIGFAVELAAPAFIPRLYKGKLVFSEPYLFGIEGYVPLHVIEELLFGTMENRLRWSEYGSPYPLSRHRPRYRVRERRLKTNEEECYEPGVQSPEVYTFPVQALDPCAPCDHCIDGMRTTECDHESVQSLDEKSGSDYGDLKVFTLIDTCSMTATLFEAVRPPVMLMIGGSEGGMKRALACSYDLATGALYRETVLRVPTRIADAMHTLPRVRLGLKNPTTKNDVEETKNR